MEITKEQPKVITKVKPKPKVKTKAKPEVKPVPKVTKKQRQDELENIKKREAKRQQEELEKLGLEVGDNVRFSRNPKSSWIKGTVLKVEKDGSLGISCDKASRSVQLEFVQKESKGPKGGKKWVSISRQTGKTSSGN